MSRWQYGNWAMAAVVMEDSGDIYPFSALAGRHPLQVKGYYSESFLLGPRYYRMDDLTGLMNAKGEGHFTIEAHVQVTDGEGKVNTLTASCDGYTACREDCYMLLILTPGKDAASTTLEFQNVDEVEIKEAVGVSRFKEWENSEESENLVYLDAAPF